MHHPSIGLLALLAIATAALLTTAAVAQDVRSAPSVYTPSVVYVTGGIGGDEKRAMESEAKDFDLHITNADMEGHFTADTDLIIRNKATGEAVIQAGNTGPLFFAQLPSGDYVIEASNGDKSITKEIKISDQRATELELIWKPT